MASEFLSAFSPRQMAPETLEELFVAREEIARRLEKAVADSTKRGVKRHALIVGPRGMGKTHLLSVLYNRLRADEALSQTARFARLSEEEYGLLSFFHLLRRTLDVLADTYADAALKKAVSDLRGLSVKDAQPRAERILDEWLGDKTLVLLAENFDDILKQLKDAGQRGLRAFLQTQQQTLLLVTTPSLSHSLVKHAAPFYGFFEVTHLKDLDAVQGRELLIRLAKRHPTMADVLVARLRAEDALPKLRAVEHMAGGHPRLWFLFSDVLTDSPLDDLTVAFRKLIDQLTPYYQSKMKDGTLSDQERAIVEAIALHREPVSVKEIAADCFLEPNTVSAQLSRITEDRYIRPERAGRESYYELSEPMLRLVLETRAAQDQYLPTLLEFLVGWNTESELRHRLETEADSGSHGYLTRALNLKQQYLSEAKRLAHQADMERWGGDHEKALEAYEKVLRKRGIEATANDFFQKAYCLNELSRYSEALESYDRALELDPKNVYAWNNRGNTLNSLSRYSEALESYDRTLELDPKDTIAWNNRGYTLYNLSRYSEALESYERALELDPKDTIAWNNRGYTLYNLSRYPEALESYDRALELDPKDSYPKFSRAVAYFSMRLWEKSEISWKKAFNELGNSSAKPKDVDYQEDCFAVCRILMREQKDSSFWKERVRAVLAIFEENGQLENFGQGMVRAIPILFEPSITDEAAEVWLEAWKANSEGKKALEIPIRLLSAAVEWKKTRNRKALLKLPIEERKILETLLPPEARAQ